MMNVNSANQDKARFNMIEQQIRPWDVLDASVLALLSVVRREDFVPAAHRTLAFADIEIPLQSPSEAAMRLGQCMLAPRLEARMLQDLALKKTDRVLEVGTGSGFMAALLAHRAAHVISLELDPALADMARNNLQIAGIDNAEVRVADGSKGLEADGPFNAIVLSGSVAEVPHVLMSQLAVGGRLVAIVGDEPVMRATVITRTNANNFRTTYPWDTSAPRLQNFAERSRFQF
jgi:protein-L-isoaspartate(D-aspartate) O-methyltransferase